MPRPVTGNLGKSCISRLPRYFSTHLPLSNQPTFASSDSFSSDPSYHVLYWSLTRDIGPDEERKIALQKENVLKEEFSICSRSDQSLSCLVSRTVYTRCKIAKSKLKSVHNLSNLLFAIVNVVWCICQSLLSCSFLDKVTT